MFTSGRAPDADVVAMYLLYFVVFPVCPSVAFCVELGRGNYCGVFKFTLQPESSGMMTSTSADI